MITLRALTIGVLLTSTARAQIVSANVDLLSPGEPGYAALPAGIAVIDYFVDLSATDVWTAAGTRVLTQNSATLVYARDPNDPDVVFITNPGLNNRYTTFVSRPRERDANARFTNGGVTAAGDYDSGPVPDIEPTLVSISWFASPPNTPGSPSADGYVARIAIDLGDFADRRDFLQLSTTPPDPQSPILARCELPFGGPGWGNATFDVPQFTGTNWYLFDPVPEPGAGSLLIFSFALWARARRTRSV